MNTTIELATDRDIAHVRQTGRSLAQKQGFSSIDQARFAIAVSELAQLFFLHSTTTALVSFRALSDGQRRGIEIRLQGSGFALDALLREQRPELPGGARRITGGAQHRSSHQFQALERTQKGATIVIEQFWQL